MLILTLDIYILEPLRPYLSVFYHHYRVFWHIWCSVSIRWHATGWQVTSLSAALCSCQAVIVSVCQLVQQYTRKRHTKHSNKYSISLSRGLTTPLPVICDDYDYWLWKYFIRWTAHTRELKLILKYSLVDWVPVSNCSCPHLYLYVCLYVVVLEISNKQMTQAKRQERTTTNWA